MNRKTFLATITAMFTAPFIGKKKESEVWKKANPRLLHYESVTISEKDREFINQMAFDPNTIPKWYVNRRKNGKTLMLLEEDLALLRRNTKNIL